VRFHRKNLLEYIAPITNIKFLERKEGRGHQNLTSGEIRDTKTIILLQDLKIKKTLS
jgi:hypothetical protein